MFSVNRGYGELNYKKLNDRSNFYWIVFLQSTPYNKQTQPAYHGVLDEDEYAEHWLWFNGKLNQKAIQRGLDGSYRDG